MDFISEAACFIILTSIIPFFETFIKKEDLNWDKSSFLILLFTCIGFVAIKSHPIYDKYGFADPLTLFVFSLFPITSLLGVYFVKNPITKKGKNHE